MTALSRRALFAAALVPALPAMPAAAEPSRLSFFAAAVRAKSADMAYRASGLISHQTGATGVPSAPEWRAHRAALMAERYAARVDLEAMTPATDAEARALVGYYAARAEMIGTPGAARRCRRRLSKILARPGAAQPGCDLPAILAPQADAPDPIFAAIRTARTADAAHTARCRALHDDDSEAADEACNAAADAMTRAVHALAQIRPTTHAGLVALVQFYVDDADGTDLGAQHLASLLAVLKPPLPS